MTYREIFMESFSTVEKLIKGTLNMDGNIFFSNRFDSSSEAIAFNFDLQRFDGEDTDTGKTAAEYNSLTDEEKAEYLYEARQGTLMSLTSTVKYFKTSEAAENYVSSNHANKGVGDDLSYVAYLTDEATAITQGYTVSATKGDTTKYFNDIRYAFDYV